MSAQGDLSHSGLPAISILGMALRLPPLDVDAPIDRRPSILYPMAIDGLGLARGACCEAGCLRRGRCRHGGDHAPPCRTKHRPSGRLQPLVVRRHRSIRRQQRFAGAQVSAIHKLQAEMPMPPAEEVGPGQPTAGLSLDELTEIDAGQQPRDSRREATGVCRPRQRCKRPLPEPDIGTATPSWRPTSRNTTLISFRTS